MSKGSRILDMKALTFFLNFFLKLIKLCNMNEYSIGDEITCIIVNIIFTFLIWMPLIITRPLRVNYIIHCLSEWVPDINHIPILHITESLTQITFLYSTSLSAWHKSHSWTNVTTFLNRTSLILVYSFISLMKC